MWKTQNKITPHARNWVALFRWGGCALLLAILAPQGAWPQETGRCARLETPWPVVLPDGSVHEPGTLRLCLKLKLNPVTGIHEIQVNGISTWMVRSRIGESEGPNGNDPIVVFQREDGGAFALVGYTWPTRGATKTFSLYGDLAGTRPAAASSARLQLDGALAEEGFVLMVARRPE